MDYDKLIEQLKKSADFEDYPIVASFAAIIEKKYLRDAATALSTLQAENSRLRAELEYEREHAPAADVAEVRHGRWIEDERTYPGPGLKNNLCSVCGEIAGSWKEGLEPGRKWAYCPNCGARMGKEDEHETD